MKIGLFDPYLDTLGGGERYALSLAEFLSPYHQVEIFWSNEKTLKKAESRFNLKLSGVRINPIFHKLFTSKNNLFKKLFMTRSFGLIFYLSDGSIPFLNARQNILHFQVPFTKVEGRSLANQIKLKMIDYVVCNSKFTQKFVDQEFNVQSQVIYPPVAVEEFKSGKKENIILSVGRYEPTLHSKKQEVMIAAFRQMIQNGLVNWRLILIGGVSPEHEDYFNQLKNQIADLPIQLLKNISFLKLKSYYSQAKIYWHAAGHGIDENKNPEKVEHFGMSTVEAMAAGCVPIVCAKGGQKEIVKNGEDGFLWQEKDELVNHTLNLIKSEELRQKIAQKAIFKSQWFSKKIFCQKFEELIKNMNTT